MFRKRCIYSRDFTYLFTVMPPTEAFVGACWWGATILLCSIPIELRAVVETLAFVDAPWRAFVVVLLSCRVLLGWSVLSICLIAMRKFRSCFSSRLTASDGTTLKAQRNKGTKRRTSIDWSAMESALATVALRTHLSRKLSRIILRWLQDFTKRITALSETTSLIRSLMSHFI